MLRITPATIDQATTCLVVEGRLAGVWLSVLDQEMTALHQLGRRVVLDLSQVTFVGSDAVEFIRTAQQKGTRLTAVSPLLGTYFRTGEP